MKSRTKEEASEELISLFLQDFSRKMTEGGIIFFNRKKNLHALLDLEITALYRERVIQQVQLEDFYRGPIIDKVHEGLTYWEFGKEVRGTEVYIKLSKGWPDEAVWCISFHRAEREIKYPLKS